ncbi:MAG: PH domain-containing protein [Pseudomonadota bacterium]
MSAPDLPLDEARDVLGDTQRTSAIPGKTPGNSANPQHTAPLSVLVAALSSIQQAIFPAVAVALGTDIRGAGLLIGLAVAGAIVALNTLFSYLAWRRLTYTVGAQDIRVESGILSRAARSVPYERIQDVSLEQKLIPRLLGLVAVKFETGAGGADDLALTYLSMDEGERLRQLVRERRDEADNAPASTTFASPEASEASIAKAEEAAQPLFAMGPRRLLIFGAFEFSLAVFAVLGGLLQYLDSILDIELWDVDFWRELAQERGGWVLELGAYAQALGAIAGLFLVFLIGSATGLVRTFSREWGFLLERTARGFRRRRGLFTRTDVVMPVHRVQALRIGTRAIRYRFGWHSLRFVSLAQDAGSASHVVAPFAKMDELAPIVEAAGFRLPSPETQWHRATKAYRTTSLMFDGVLFGFAAIVAGVFTVLYAPEWALLSVGLVLGVGVLDACATLIAWHFKRHALDAEQITVRSGVLSPTSQIATRVKLHSVEISQGPIARWKGYATLHLGLAGSELSIPGIPLERARAVRSQILETIAQTDFSRLERA